MVAFFKVAVKVFDKQLETLATQDPNRLAAVKNGKMVYITVELISPGLRHLLPP